jgi:uncharacterized protein involved in outer membrane biogenesis
MLKKLLIGLGVLVALIIAVIIVGPQFVDWNSYKAQIAAKAKEATGRDLAIDGNIALSILPSPTLSVAKVRFANAPGGSVPDMATLDSLDVRVALLPLLQGVVKVESVTLVAPKIVLETLPDGTPNWQLTPAEKAPGGGTGTGGGKQMAIQLDKLSIERGTLIYRDASGTSQTIENLAAQISAGSLQGPFLASGSATVRGTPVKFDASVGALTGQQPAAVDLAVLLTDPGAKLSFNGSMSLSATPPTINGKLHAEGGDLAKLIGTAVPAMRGGLPPTVAQPFAVNGDVAVATPSASIKNLSLQLGDAQAAGQLLLDTGTPLKADLSLALQRVDLDKLLGPAAAPAAGGGDQAAPAAAPAQTAPAPAAGGAPAAGFALPANVEVKLAVSADAVTYRGGIIGNARLEAALANGVLEVTRVSADLPGSSSFMVAGRVAPAQGQPGFTGTLNAKSDNLRGVLDWLKLPRPNVAPDRLRKVTLAAKLGATPAALQVSDLDLRFDATKITGGAVVSLPQAGHRTRPGYGVGIAIDQINLDGYLPPAGKPAATGGGQADKAAKPAPAAKPGLPLDGLKPLAAIDANVEVRVGTLVANGQTAKGVHLDATLQDGKLTLRDASVKDFAGGRGALSGTVADLGGTPRFDTQLDLAAGDAGKVLQFAGMANPPAGLGAVKAGGKLAGGGQEVSYDLSFSLAGIGAQGAAKGKVAGIGAGVPRIDSTFQLSANDAGPLLALAGRPAAGKLGALAINGKAASGADDLTYNVSLTLAGVGGRGTLDGRITQLTGTPQVDTKLDLKADNPGPLLAMAGVGGDLAGKTGPLGVAGTLRGGADKMALDLTLAAFGGNAAIKGEVGAGQSPPSFALDISANHPDVRKLAAALTGSASGGGPAGPFKLSTQAKGTAKKATLSNLVVEAGPSRLTGNVAYDGSGSRPRVDADLQAGTLDLAALGAAGGGSGSAGTGGGGAATGGGSGGGHWSRKPMDFSALDKLDGNFSFTADMLVAGGTQIAKPVVKASLQGGKLTLSRFTGGVYGGTLDASGELASRGVPSLTAVLKAANLQVEQIAKVNFLGSKIGGPLSLNADFSATGNSQAEMIESLNGKGTLGGSVRLLTKVEQQVGAAALDLLGQKVKQLRGVTDVVGGAFNDFVGSNNTLSGDFVIRRGVLETQNTTLANPRAKAVTHGTVNLPAYTLNTATDVIRGQSAQPYITVALTGPADGPNVKISGAGFASGGAGGSPLQNGAGGLLQQVAPGLSNKLGVGGTTGGTTGSGAPGAGGLTPPPPPSDVTGGTAQNAAPGSGGLQPGQQPPAQQQNQQKKKNKNQQKLDTIIPQLFGQ